MPFERLEDRAVKRVIKSKGKYLRIKGLMTLRLTVRLLSFEIHFKPDIHSGN